MSFINPYLWLQEVKNNSWAAAASPVVGGVVAAVSTSHPIASALVALATTAAMLGGCSWVTRRMIYHAPLRNIYANTEDDNARLMWKRELALIHDKPDDNMKAQLFRSRIKDDCCANCIDEYKPLLSHFDGQPASKSRVLRLLDQQFDSLEERKCFVKEAVELFQEGMHPEDYYKIVEKFSEIPLGQKAATDAIITLRYPGISLKQKVLILAAVAKQAPDLPEWRELLVQLFYEAGTDDTVNLSEALVSLHKSAKFRCTGSLNSKEHVEILYALMQVPVAGRKSRLGFAAMIFELNSPLLYPNNHVDSLPKIYPNNHVDSLPKRLNSTTIIKFIALEKEKIEEFVFAEISRNLQNRRLFSGEHPLLKYNEIFALIVSIASREEKERFIMRFLPLVRSGSPTVVYNVFQTFANTPEDEQDLFVAQVESLHCMDHGDNIETLFVVQNLAAVSGQKRAVILQTIQEIIRELNRRMDHAEVFLLKMLTSTPQKHWPRIVPLLKRLIIHPLLTNPDVIFTAVSNIPSVERAGRIRRALVAWRPPEQNYLRLIQLLETPLNQPLPPEHNDMAVMAAAGQNVIDVHAGTRDRKTREAVNLLRAQQGDLTKEEIRESVEQFSQYLHEEKSLNAELQKKALFALEGEWKDNDWGALLQEENFSLDTLGIYGSEFVARLWRFSNTYEDPKGKTEDERINCKRGMAVLLASSVQEERRVCNPGKMQAMAIGVLQGRIKGVNIDGMPIEEASSAAPPPPRTLQSVELFFNHSEYQAIERWEDLLKKAEQFCEENPLIDKGPFLREIEAFHKETYPDA